MCLFFSNDDSAVGIGVDGALIDTNNSGATHSVSSGNGNSARIGSGIGGGVGGEVIPVIRIGDDTHPEGRRPIEITVEQTNRFVYISMMLWFITCIAFH